MLLKFLLRRGWYSQVTGILPLAEKSDLNEVMIIMCMSSKADKPCNSKHMVKVSFVRLYVSFVQLFLSHDMVYAY